MITGNWVGKILGTNEANIYIDVVEHENELTGKVTANDPVYGLSRYSLKGSINGTAVNMVMAPEHQSSERVLLGEVFASGNISNGNIIDGKWHSSIGTEGVFYALYAETYDNSIAEPAENSAFIIMAISDAQPELEDYLLAIKRAFKKYGIDSERVDEIEHSGKITDLILNMIKKSRFIICDISKEKPNVYYELGYAHGLKREVILVAKIDSIVHFDIKDYNIIFYKNSTELETRVAKRIEETLQ